KWNWLLPHADDHEVRQSWCSARRKPHHVDPIIAVFRDPANPCPHPIMRPRINRRATLDAGDPRDDVTPTHAVDAHFEELVLRRRQQVDVALSSGKCTGALDSTDAKDQPLRRKAGAAANVFGAARRGYHQR